MESLKLNKKQQLIVVMTFEDSTCDPKTHTNNNKKSLTAKPNSKQILYTKILKKNVSRTNEDSKNRIFPCWQLVDFIQLTFEVCLV